MGKRNGILRELEKKGRCRIDMPPRDSPEYMRTYKRISRMAERNKQTHGRQWIDPTLDWLKQKRFVELLLLCYIYLVIDFSWIMQILIK